MMTASTLDTRRSRENRVNRTKKEQSSCIFGGATWLIGDVLGQGRKAPKRDQNRRLKKKKAYMYVHEAPWAHHEYCGSRRVDHLIT